MAYYVISYKTGKERKYDSIVSARAYAVKQIQESGKDGWSIGTIADAPYSHDRIKVFKDKYGGFCWQRFNESKVHYIKPNGKEDDSEYRGFHIGRY